MSFDPDKITFFAKTDARGQQVSFGIKAKDRQRHMYVVGKTGMGKSTLLENMAAQDIQNGEGMAFIDPHGSAAETLLDYVPEHRIDDVVYFAPFDLSNPISFNVMEDVGPDKRHLVVSGLMSTFKKIWVDAWSARMEYILTNALLALIEYPDTTLLSVNRLFSDKAYRKQVVEYIKDPAVKAFWTEEFANYTDRFAAEALPSIQNKIGQFTGNPLIRNIIGQPHSSFDIRKIMDEKKILIMNLSKGLVGETNANLLGSMLTTRIYLAAMSRANLSVDKMRTMPNFYFYVDEFQSFANSTFSNILSEARKYHLNLIIAHQYIEQMEEDVRSAVFGNVGTTIAFRVGPFDAEVLETVFSPRFTATDLVNLGFAQIYLTLMIDGIGSQPFSAVTLPPVERPSVSCREMVLAASRKNYTKDREAVENLITDLHIPVKPDFPKKRTPTNDKNDKTESTNKPDRNNNTNYKPAPPKNFADKKPFREKKDKDNEVNNRSRAVSTEDENKRPASSDESVRKGSRTSPKTLTNEPTQKINNSPKHSLSELRSVLGKISNNNVSDSGSNDNENKNTNNNIGKPSEQNKNVGGDDDLRSALALLLKKTDKSKSGGDSRDNHVNKQTTKDSQESKVKQDTSSTSKDNSSKKQTVDSADDNSYHVNRKELEELSAEVEETLSLLDNVDNAHSRATPDDTKQNTDKSEDTSPTENVSGNIFAPKSVQEKSYKTDSDPLTPDKIKKQLRQSPDERTPFAS